MLSVDFLLNQAALVQITSQPEWVFALGLKAGSQRPFAALVCERWLLRDLYHRGC